MKKTCLINLLVVLCIVILPPCILAAENNVGINMQDKPGPETPKGQSVSNYALAAELIDFGTQNKNPTAMLVALQLLKEIQVTQSGTMTKSNSGSQASPENRSLIMAKYQPDNILRSAYAMAEGDQLVTGLLQRETKRTNVQTRGFVEGPMAHEDLVKAQDIDTYEVRFKGKELARVALVGDGKCDLDLFIFDENENEITRDTRSSNNAIAEWTPRRTGLFSLKVVNLRCSTPSEYLLLVN